MALLVAGSLISSAFSVATTISRRVTVYCSTKIAHRSEDDSQKQFLTDFVAKIEEDTKLILEALKSFKASELETARQFVQIAMDDLNWWIKQNESTLAIRYEGIIEDLSRLDFTKIYVESARFQEAINQLWEAYRLSALVFNDKVSSTPEMRIKALEIRIFCITVIRWQDPDQWFIKWEKEFEFFFDDHELKKLIFPKQKMISKIFKNKHEKLARLHMIHLMESLGNVMNDMLQYDCNRYFSECIRFVSFIESKVPRKFLTRVSSFERLYWTLWWSAARTG